MSRPRVFIIESLDFNDEKKERYEGKILSQILRLGGKESKYYYIRTVKELKNVLQIFRESNYRYLHISCHGTYQSLFTTLEEMTFREFGNVIKPYLKNRRLFISACSAVNSTLAKELIPNTGCFSLIGPKKDIHFHDAAIIWASFYHLMFKENPDAMNRAVIVNTLRNIKKTFGIAVNYYTKSSSNSSGFKKILIDNMGHNVSNNSLTRTC